MRNKPNSINKVVKWLWKDLLYPHKKTFAFNFLLDLGGILSQVAAYGLLLKYVNALEQAEPLDLLGRTFEPQTSQVLLTSVALGTGLLFFASSLIDYWSKIRVINLQRTYEEFCSNRIIRVLEKMSSSGMSEADINKAYDGQRLRKTLVKDARFCGKTVKTIAMSMIIMVKFAGSLAVMFYISTSLTLVILLLILPMIFILKKLGKSVVSFTQLREIRILGFIGNKKRQMRIALQKKSPHEKAEEASQLSDEINQFYDIYYKVLKKLALSDFVIILFIALLAIVIVLVAGNLVLFGSMTWTVFIAYVVVLRFFFNSMQGLNNFIKKSSRMYDYLKHYTLTLQSLESGKGAPALDEYKRSKKKVKGQGEGMALDLDDEDSDEEDDDDDM